jgi:hypothetical protein
MGSTENHDKGPTHGGSARGYSAAYEADRPRAQRALDQSMTGVSPPLDPDDAGIKDPDKEFAHPAPMIHPAPGNVGPGPNNLGNSKGDGSIDPQGQQAGTHGGQPGSEAPGSGGPLASEEGRIDRSTQRSAGGHAEGPA